MWCIRRERKQTPVDKLNANSKESEEKQDKIHKDSGIAV